MRRLALMVVLAVGLLPNGQARALQTAAGSATTSSSATTASQTPVDQSPAQTPIAPPASPPTADEIVAVPDSVRSVVRESLFRPGMSQEEKLERLVEYVFGPRGIGLQYDSRTRTISEVIRDHTANCLSFALMFKALAREAGLDAYIQETDHVVAWYGADTLYQFGHVNVGVKIGFKRKTVDIDSSILMVLERPRVISDARALAHFYNNRGAEFMEDGDLGTARKYLDIALGMDANFLPARNNLGVLEMRAGFPERARKNYLGVTSTEPKDLAALSNLVNLYQQVGDRSRQAKAEKRLFSVQRKDPFYQVVQALNHERSGDYAKAVDFYRRAIRLMGGEHHLYFGLARSYAHLGDIDRAKDALIRARDASGDDQRSLYQAKLERLQPRAVH